MSHEFLLQISAQESRRKKKEYMDGLERKVEVLSSQNVEYKKRINSLEDSNSTLVSQVQKLQEMLGLRHLPTYNGAFVSKISSFSSKIVDFFFLAL